MALITTKQLSKSFKGTEAVKGIDLHIKEGVCTALLGPNGAGKSTTLNMLTGLMKPTSGSIAFDERYSGDRRQYIGYLPQYPKFYGWMTGEEYLVYAGQLGSLSKEDAKARAEELLKLVGLIDDRKKRIQGYSGGMKQRLGIAQALVHKPKLVILDEPVSALDPKGRREVLELMDKLKETTSILFSTHVLHDAEEICEEIFIINHGELIVSGDLQTLKKKYQQPTIYIETEEPIEDWSRTIKDSDWIRHMKVNKNELTISVTDIENARNALLTNEELRKLKIVNFEIVKTSLEDLFMEVTKA
ncbi:ABC transporter ATP-binding protein [Evansella cellulosilytica]|uniref:ABC transporter related protein n=1 Tax=Evansella cellulosilytica (strain ATCC 21833 / DSM 2522 / FERM P-1141 / JCM 9156 / N-4) TaxID=649639 RepID=E6U2B7_EVAC2|nr:ABC transporter ATP-binding protein [Evansella cellulosilytica]ADU31630.1 ABC transporter related protein [Evansella cellulosilytica DSM 2522]